MLRPAWTGLSARSDHPSGRSPTSPDSSERPEANPGAHHAGLGTAQLDRLITISHQRPARDRSAHRGTPAPATTRPPPPLRPAPHFVAGSGSDQALLDPCWIPALIRWQGAPGRGRGPAGAAVLASRRRQHPGGGRGRGRRAGTGSAVGDHPTGADERSANEQRPWLAHSRQEGRPRVR